jgi:predicted GTPase
MVIIISADEIKKTLPNYSPDKAEEFHHQSAKQADKQFSQALKDNQEEVAILMNGGTASGKSEFLATQLSKLPNIIFDATQSTP